MVDVTFDDAMSSIFSARRWLARLTYSFLIVAAVLAWRGYQLGKTDGRLAAGPLLCFAGSVACGVLAGLGGRARREI